MSTRGDIDTINEGVTFDAQSPRDDQGEHDGTRPCMTVAGVQVYAYVKDGEIVVSLDYDTAGHSEHCHPGVLDGKVLGWTDGEGLPAYASGGIPTRVNVGSSLEIRIDREGQIVTTTGA